MNTIIVIRTLYEYSHLMIVPCLNKYITLPILNNLQRPTSMPIKDCKKCVYYLSANISEYSECIKFGKPYIHKNMENRFEYAKDCRNDELKCGFGAKYFRSKST